MTAQAGSIDAHAHWAPEEYVRYLAQLGRQAAGGALSPLMYDLPKRLAWMDERAIRMHVLTLSGQMPWQWATQDQADRIATMVNDAAVEAHRAFPDRFIAGITLPVRDATASLRELDRLAGKPGIRAVHLPNSIEGHDYLFEPEYLPLLARCEELALPLLFHPMDGVANHYGGIERLAGATFMYNTLGFPFETATTAAKFISTGLLDRFPKLDIVLPHSGGCFPYIAGRIEHSIRRGVSSIELKAPFRDYIRRFHYDTLAYYPETLRFMIELVGADRVVIGSDNYAKMEVDEPNALVESIGLPSKELELILRANSTRLFKLA